MLLLNIDQGEIIHWLPHGLAFKVVDNEKFSEGVLPKYFKRKSSNISTFTKAWRPQALKDTYLNKNMSRK